MGSGQWAGFEAAKDTVTVAGDGVVNEVADRFRQELEQKGDSAPTRANLFEHKKNGIRAGEEKFRRRLRIRVDDEIDGVEIARIEIVAGEKAGGQSALQGSEAELALVITTEDELDKAIAQAADTVVKEDGARHEWATSKTLASAGGERLPDRRAG